MTPLPTFHHSEGPRPTRNQKPPRHSAQLQLAPALFPTPHGSRKLPGEAMKLAWVPQAEGTLRGEFKEVSEWKPERLL